MISRRKCINYNLFKVNTFASPHLVFEEKNEPFVLENASIWHTGFCMTILTRKFNKIFLLTLSLSRRSYMINHTILNLCSILKRVSFYPPYENAWLRAPHVMHSTAKGLKFSYKNSFVKIDALSRRNGSFFFLKNEARRSESVKCTWINI